MPNTNQIMIIAGEASGDLHGAKLVQELKTQHPEMKIKGMGGILMRQAGVDMVVDIANFSVCGFIEVIRYLPKIYSLFRKIKKELVENPPDLLVLIDYPSFNLRMAKIAKKLNIKVLYYISPQIWAWHTSRVHKIKNCVDMMAVIFPFESDFYHKHDVPVKYVGHPLAGLVSPSASKEIIKSHYRFNEADTIIGLLPGSRKNEIRYILPTLLQSAELLQKEHPSLKFILPLADTLTEDDLAADLARYDLNIKIVAQQRYDVMSICDAVVAASGTVTLELTLLGIPQVIVYKANSLSFYIAKNLVKIPYIGLSNIVAGEKIVAELLQEEATPEKIKIELLRLLENPETRERQKQQLKLVAEKLATRADCRLTDLVSQLVTT